eukprot:11157861-Lingulodinium_polyedra.AAC.1
MAATRPRNIPAIPLTWANAPRCGSGMGETIQSQSKLRTYEVQSTQKSDWSGTANANSCPAKL